MSERQKQNDALVQESLETIQQHMDRIKTFCSSVTGPVISLGRPVLADDCNWEMWSGIVGITEDLIATDGGSLVGDSRDLPERERKALARHAISLWRRFAAGEYASPPADEEDEGPPAICRVRPKKSKRVG